MIIIQIRHLILQKDLRYKLKKPMGTLIAGTIEETTPRLLEYLNSKSSALTISVGDVVSEILLENNYFPGIIVTDGYTKRVELDKKINHHKYRVINVICPAAEISTDAWNRIREIVKKNNEFIHLLVEGEEDLLVLPFLVEAPLGSIIIYGQPNEGVVIRELDQDAKSFAIEFMGQMHIK